MSSSSKCIDTFRKGIDAFREGLTPDANPFKDIFSEDYNDWELGWKWAKNNKEATPEPMSITRFYSTKPTSGKGKKAWERYVKEMEKAPKQMYYMPNYYGNKGWVCERDIDLDKYPRGHGRVYETFYPSASL